MLHTYAADHVRVTGLDALAFLRGCLGDDLTEVAALAKTQRGRRLMIKTAGRTSRRKHAQCGHVQRDANGYRLSKHTKTTRYTTRDALNKRLGPHAEFSPALNMFLFLHRTRTHFEALKSLVFLLKNDSGSNISGLI